MDHNEILTARSPAGLAEEFIVKSIWNQRFPVGSDLPAERELAEMIGITRTTLREVLQRLARDGWLTIQHGKATKVNNIWETAGPNIIDTLITLDTTMLPTIITNVVSLRTRMGEVYIPEAIKLNPEATTQIFASLDHLIDDATSYAEFDYNLYHQFTFIANKPVYGLILNSFKELYHRVAVLVFTNPDFRRETLAFYRQLSGACQKGDAQYASLLLEQHRQYSNTVWSDVLQQLQKRNIL